MEQLIEQLRTILGTNFGLYFKSHSYHWNIEGADFVQYHTYLGDFYTQVFNNTDFIAEKINTNIRELEGAYIRVVSLASANGEEINLKTAADILKINLNENTGKQVNMNQILKAVCNYYSVKAIDIKGAKRTKDLVLPRQVTMYLIQNITKTPLMTIGDFLGGRDHTTILHGTQKIERDIQENKMFKLEVEQVKKKVFED